MLSGGDKFSEPVVDTSPRPGEIETVLASVVAHDSVKLSPGLIADELARKYVIVGGASDATRIE